MKKIGSREFQKRFSELNEKLKPGQSVEITRYGKPMAVYTKGAARRIKMPNFLAALKNDPKLGDELIREYYDSLS